MNFSFVSAGVLATVHGGATISYMTNNPLNFNDLRNIQKRIRSLEKRLKEHIEKLDAYKKDPWAFDNQDLLLKAKNDKIRQQIIEAESTICRRKLIISGNR